MIQLFQSKLKHFKYNVWEDEETKDSIVKYHSEIEINIKLISFTELNLDFKINYYCEEVIG